MYAPREVKRMQGLLHPQARMHERLTITASCPLDLTPFLPPAIDSEEYINEDNNVA